MLEAMISPRIGGASAGLKTSTAAVKFSASGAIVETARRPGLTFPDEVKSYAPPDKMNLPIRFLEVNKDIAIRSAPIELFCEVALEIREKSKFKNTLYFGYTNGWLGYLLTPNELKNGGYEPRVSPYTAQAAGDLTYAVLQHIGRK